VARTPTPPRGECARARLAVGDQLHVGGDLLLAGSEDDGAQLNGFVQGAGRRNRTSSLAVTNGITLPGKALQPRSSASRSTAAALWQSSSVEMMPPLR
jgi:hypothetical protein